ncbi:cytochrome C heme lyase, partial [Vibrio metoecus]
MDGMTLILGAAVVVAMAVYLVIRTPRRVAVGFVGVVTIVSVGLFLWMQQP